MGRPAILHPFPDIAVHIIEAERVRLVGADGKSLVWNFRQTGTAVGVGFAGRVAPGVLGRGAAAGRVLPFGFAWRR